MDIVSQTVGSEPESILHALHDGSDSEGGSTSTVPVDGESDSDGDDFDQKVKNLSSGRPAEVNMANITTASQEAAAAAIATNADKDNVAASKANKGELPPPLEKPDENMEDAFVQDPAAELRRRE